MLLYEKKDPKELTEENKKILKEGYDYYIENGELWVLREEPIQNKPVIAVLD